MKKRLTISLLFLCALVAAASPKGGTFNSRSQNAKDLKPLVSYLRRCNFMLQLGKPYNNATDCRIMEDGTTIRFTDDSKFEVTFPDGTHETWDPIHDEGQ